MVEIGSRVHPKGKAHPSGTVVSDLGEAWWVLQDDGKTEVWYKFETLPWLTTEEVQQYGSLCG